MVHRVRRPAVFTGLDPSIGDNRESSVHFIPPCLLISRRDIASASTYRSNRDLLIKSESMNTGGAEPQIGALPANSFQPLTFQLFARYSECIKTSNERASNDACVEADREPMP